MFETLEAQPQDPILALMVQYRQDTHPQKVDLGVGVYKDEQGDTPIMDAVKQAEALRAQNENTKSYLSPAGAPGFNSAITELLLGADHSAIADNRVYTAQAPGGCGALRMAAEFIKVSNPDCNVWISDPTWANHEALIGGAGLAIKRYPYYDPQTHGVDFDSMMEALEQAAPGDAVLLHGCCHNPSGADLNEEQWQVVASLCQRKGLLPFIDIAYQGLGRGLDEDAFGVRLMAAQLPEVMVASSCSKNFGLYRERTGAVMVIGADAEQGRIAFTQLLSIIRSNYSMPPAHGAAIVEIILGDATLRANWEAELAEMRERIQQLRGDLVKQLANRGHDFSFIEAERGMFSFLGITLEQVRKLRSEHHLYIVDSSRVNIAGLSSSNLERVVGVIDDVL
ncbi:MAG: amino acid aminotransferase [Motiliproteus sp.]